ncbi:MAG TPA: adenylate kinase family protein [Candidatus Thermoplasmatota archaeon]|nr:adenylate kinase family protein [Candidatus Thermoplasmatota archaeon]
MTPGWVALTGTPGVGKSTVAKELRRLGLVVVDGKRYARRHGCVVGVDAERRSQIVDPRRVGRALRREKGEGVRVLETHWAHDVPGVTDAVVLRLNPRVLERRLRARRWNRAKVRENLEAEAMGIILHESVENLGRRHVVEVDATHASARAVARRLAPWLRDTKRRVTNLEIGRVDWTAELLRWY